MHKKTVPHTKKQPHHPPSDASGPPCFRYKTRLTDGEFCLSTLNCKGLPDKVTTVHVIKRQPPALQGAMYLLNTCLYLL
ncbi:hypothetical protein UUU_26080 (plasmid) [Klebsiella pneumoniae subsp. pneumoniae DSM 30104 = JCM 1662 = NBRC 14940]|nr:hypothetical protein UUU_26080 [Klebsiella pneumoniae subsp. pneumoniae DSM 30104 = JCM 1662 = NBRC 14940]